MASSASDSKLSDLPQLRRLITSHNEDGKAIVHSTEESPWQPYDNAQMAFSVVCSTSSFPPDLHNNSDLKVHKELMKKGVGLFNPNGIIIRCVDFAPGYARMMHRTQIKLWYHS